LYVVFLFKYHFKSICYNAADEMIFCALYVIQRWVLHVDGTVMASFINLSEMLRNLQLFLVRGGYLGTNPNWTHFRSIRCAYL